MGLHLLCTCLERLDSKISRSVSSDNSHWELSPVCRIICCCSITKSSPTLCDPVGCSTPCSSVFHYLPSLLQFMSIESVMPSSQLILCRPLLLCLQSFPASGSFPMSRLFASGGQSIGASASVLPMNSQSWFPLGLTGLISLLSKGFWRILSSTTIQKHQFFSAQPSLG